MASGLRREMKKILDYVKTCEGWEVVDTRKGHHRATGPGRALIYCPSTPSDWRSINNTLSLFRQAGLRITRKS